MAKAATTKAAMDKDMKEYNKPITSKRSKLKNPVDLNNFATQLRESGEGQFEFEFESHQLAEEEMKENMQKKQKKRRLGYFENSKLRNITAKAVSDDSSENTILLSSFSYLATKFDNVTDDGGVKKKLERAGNGKTPPPNGRVWINYEVWLEETDEPIDSTYHKKQPYSFKLFQNDVLAVLEYGVASMEMKEKSRFLATPEYAYGQLGLPGIVPPNSMALFVIELIDFMEAASVSSVFRMSAEERLLLNFEEIRKAANELKTVANQYCQNKQWSNAIPKYRKAIHMLERYLNPNAHVEQQRNDFLFALYNNMAMCNLQLEEYHKTILMIRKALELPPGTNGNICKAYYRLAKAEYELGHFEESRRVCRIALTKEPCNKEVREFYEKVIDRLAEDEKVQKSLCQKMFAKMSLKEGENQIKMMNTSDSRIVEVDAEGYDIENSEHSSGSNSN